MLSIDDELGDVPEDERMIISREISSFRERSAKRDQERARRFEEVENRRIALEQEARRVKNNVSNDKTNDVQEVALIRRTAKPRTDLDSEQLNDTEILHRKHEAARQQLDSKYIDEERRWQIREETHLAAFKREQERSVREVERREAAGDRLAHKLRDWNDKDQADAGHDLYYADHAAWLRARRTYRIQESEADRLDRLEEEREQLAAQKAQESTEAERAAEQEAVQNEAASGSATVPRRLALNMRQEEQTRTAINTEVILEDDEEGQQVKRVLVPHEYKDRTNDAAGESRQDRLQAIVDLIPTKKEDLWSYTVAWSKLQADMLAKIRAFVAKKLVEAIGMEEEDLIAFIMRTIESHGTPGQIEKELASAIGDVEEAELLTIKCWRFLLILLETSGI